MGLYEFMFGGDAVEEDLENTESFFSKEAGQKRTEALNKAINDNLDYYLGPTGIPNKLRSGNELLNPVVGISDAGQAVEEGRYLDAVTETAAAALPVAGAIAAKPLVKGLASVSDDVADAATALKETMLGGSFNPDRRKFVAAAAASPAALMLPPMDEVATATSKQLEDIFSPQTLAKLSDEDFSQMLSNLDEKMYDGELADELTEFFDDPASMPEIDNVLREAQRRGMYENSAFNTFLDYQLPETSLAMVPDGGSPSVISKVVDEPEIELPPASNSQRTQIAGTLPTYKKADALLTDLSGEGSTLDYGAGLGLSQRELGYDTFEPFPREGFEPTFNSGADIPEGSYKRITNLNVLNVVPKETRDEIVKDIGRILQPDGTAIITTRGRDVLNAKGDAGPEAMSLITSAGTYQKGFTQSELREYVQETLGDNFEVVNNKLGAAGVTIRKKSSGTVPATVAEQTENMLDTSKVVPGGNPEFGPTGRISTRMPLQAPLKDEIPAEEFYSGELTIGRDVMDEAGTTEKNMEYLASNREQSDDVVKSKGTERPLFTSKTPNPYEDIGDVPYFPGFKALEGMSTEDRVKFVSAMQKENLEWVMDKLPQGFQDRAKLWYTGANRFSEELSSKYGVPRQSMSGVLAALSPQKDWFQNASLAERVADAAINNRNFPWSSEMSAVVNKYPTFKTGGRGKNAAIWESIQGKKYSELETTKQKAMWIRAYDEAHNPKTYRALTPEGDLGEIILAGNSPKDIAWGGFNTIEKAVDALESGGDFKILSDTMGGQHKVRNFFNNIEVPFSDMGDVTIDTHAIAAALMRPLGGDDRLVAQGLGAIGGQNKSLGAKGNYGFIADDYRDVADNRGLLPREVQSITWEGIRSLFNNKSDAVKRKVNTIWSQVDKGKLTQQEALDLIEAEMGGFGATNQVLTPRTDRSIAAGSSTMFAAGGLALLDDDIEEEGFATPQ